MKLSSGLNNKLKSLTRNNQPIVTDTHHIIRHNEFDVVIYNEHKSICPLAGELLENGAVYEIDSFIKGAIRLACEQREWRFGSIKSTFELDGDEFHFDIGEGKISIDYPHNGESKHITFDLNVIAKFRTLMQSSTETKLCISNNSYSFVMRNSGYHTVISIN